MFTHIQKWTIASAIAGVGLIGSVQAAALEELNFGIISTESSQNLKETWDPFLEDMSEQTGLKINAFFAPDYAGIIQGMRFDKVDIAWYGNKSAIEAVDRAGGEVIFKTVAANGNAGYWSILIAHKDSPINSVEDMLANAKDLNFGNGDPNSTSGYLVPGYYVFAQNGVEPTEIFKRTLNSNHEVNALSVANKRVDIATFNSEGMERLKDTHPGTAENLKVIWTSPLIPSDPIVWRKNLPEETKTKILDFMSGYGSNDAEIAILNDLQWAPFERSDNDQLLPIRQLDLFKQRSDIVADTTLDEAEKAKQVEELDAALAQLDARMTELAGKQTASVN